MRLCSAILLFSLAATALACSPVQKSPIPEEPAPFSDGPDEYVATSPKAPWSDFGPTEVKDGSPWWSAALLWVPNRVLDLVDVFRVDVGVGPSFGGVIRMTEFGQVGYRQMAPFSLRIGNFGRRLPALVERSNELGAGPAFLQSPDREVCTGEFGLGVDLLLLGGYGGICVEELADFLTGLLFIDIMDDDL